MGKKAETIRVVCPMCLQEFSEMKENEITPRHLFQEKDCRGTGRPLEKIVTLQYESLVYRN